MSELRAVVVDDEPLAREGLVELLLTIPGITIAGAFADGASALVGLDDAKADILFVDVAMPGMTGIEMVECLDLDPMPAIVFATAYDSFAMRAFELNAMDYLLKPVTTERLSQTVARVRSRADEGARIVSLLKQHMRDERRGVGRLIVREVGKVTVVPTNDVDWIEGADYYAKLHVGPKVHLIRETLASLELRLATDQFFRVHRSTIVNLARVRSVEAAERGDGNVVLLDGTKVRVTASRREALENALSV